MDIMEVNNGNGVAVWNIGNEILTSINQLEAAKVKEGARIKWTDINMEKFEENPYDYVDGLLASAENQVPSCLRTSELEGQVLKALHLKYLERRLETSTFEEIPSLNDHDTVRVKNGQLVRFRCMIQDHVGSEYAVTHYKVTNPITNEVETKYTLLRDSEDEDFELKQRNLIEKELYVVISPPGESFWVSEEKDSSSASENKKAKLNDSGEEGNFISLPNYKDIVPSLFTGIGEGKPMACVLKMYKHDKTGWKHNELIEVTALIQIPSGETNPGQESDEIAYPELTKLPILHVFSYVTLANGNPKIALLEEKMFPMFPLSDIRVMESANALREVFSLALGGDRFAAIYAISAITARVQFLDAKVAGGPLGRAIINLCGISEFSDIPDLLTYVIKSLVPRVVNLEFGIESVNAMKLIPTKNMNTNQLEPGLFQLPIGTQIIINETGLQEGKFDPAGYRNLVALRELLVEQKVKYDYTYQFPLIEANFPVLILSKSPTVLPFDNRIDVRPDSNLTLEERRSRIETILKEKGDMLRNHLSLLRCKAFPERLFDRTDQTLVDDIVQYLGHRNSSPLYNSKMNATEYSGFISSCRAWCLMHGAPFIDRDGFTFWKELERIRDGRLAG